MEIRGRSHRPSDRSSQQHGARREQEQIPSAAAVGPTAWWGMHSERQQRVGAAAAHQPRADPGRNDWPGSENAPEPASTADASTSATAAPKPASSAPAASESPAAA